MLAYSQFLNEAHPEHLARLATHTLNALKDDEVLALKAYVATSVEINKFVRDPEAWKAHYDERLAKYLEDMANDPHYDPSESVPKHLHTFDTMQKRAAVMKSAISKHIIPKPTIVYRGTYPDELARMFPSDFIKRLSLHTYGYSYGTDRPGSTRFPVPLGHYVYKTNQFLSTSTQPRIAWNSFAGGVMFIIHVPSGKRAMPIHRHIAGLNDHEDEVLFAPGAVFRIDGVEARIKGRSARILMTCISDGLH